MNREEFLRGLENALSGNVPPSVVRDNLRYYDDYIRSERQKGRSESDIMDELGDPRLIARTILDTTPGAAEGEYEEYHPFSSFAGNSGRTSQQEEPQQAQYGNYGGTGNIHYYNLNKWYWKLLAVVVVILFFTLVLTIIGGILTLVIPLLPVIGIVALVMAGSRSARLKYLNKNAVCTLLRNCRVTHFKNPGIFFCFRVFFCFGAVQLQKPDNLVTVNPDLVISILLGFIKDQLHAKVQMRFFNVVGVFRAAVAGAAQIADHVSGLDIGTLREIGLVGVVFAQMGVVIVTFLIQAADPNPPAALFQPMAST